MAILIACVPLDIDVDVLGGGVTVGGTTDDGAVGGATDDGAVGGATDDGAVGGATDDGAVGGATATVITVVVGSAVHMGVPVAGGTDISADIVDTTEVGTGIAVEVMETVEIIMNYC